VPAQAPQRKFGAPSEKKEGAYFARGARGVSVLSIPSKKAESGKNEKGGGLWPVKLTYFLQEKPGA